MFAGTDTDAMIVPVAVYADIVESRPRVVGQEGGITMITEQLILPPRTFAVVEKFK